MKVKMNVQISGSRDGVEWPAIGGEITVSAAEGADLCSQGHAVPVVTTAPEKAVVPEPEKRGAKRVRPAAR